MTASRSGLYILHTRGHPPVHPVNARRPITACLPLDTQFFKKGLCSCLVPCFPEFVRDFDLELFAVVVPDTSNKTNVSVQAFSALPV